MSEITRITRSMMVAAMERAALEKGPDYVYWNPNGGETCRNVHVDDNGVKTPGCIVGHVMAAEGWVSLDSMPLGGSVSIMIDVLAKNGLHMSTRAHDFANKVQQYQDRRFPWGKAILRAKRDSGMI